MSVDPMRRRFATEPNEEATHSTRRLKELANVSQRCRHNCFKGNYDGNQGSVSQKGPISSATISFISSQHRGSEPVKLCNCNPLGFPYIKNMVNDQLFTTSGLQFGNLLFGPENSPGLSRNRPSPETPENNDLIGLRKHFRAARTSVQFLDVTD